MLTLVNCHSFYACYRTLAIFSVSVTETDFLSALLHMMAKMQDWTLKDRTMTDLTTTEWTLTDGFPDLQLSDILKLQDH